METHLNDLVTDHMRKDFARLRVGDSVGQALESIRKKPPEGRVIYFYVVDEADSLCGVVPTRRLLLTPMESPISEIMVPKVITIPSTASVLEACEFFLMHRLLAFPVVDENKRLVGLVDVELYTNELTDLDRREDSDDLFQLIGVHLTEAQQTSSIAAFQNRFPWLMANIVGGVLAAFLSGIFEAELKKAVSLAMFIPVVLALAESVSIQSVSLALQSLHHKQPTWRTIAHKLRLELLTGFFLGGACSLTVAIVALLWLGQPDVVACLLGGILGGVTFAATVGVAIPYGLRWLNREPQVAAGPIALAMTDMVTLLIYFSLARLLLG
jgi:magnesium transporter